MSYLLIGLLGVLISNSFQNADKLDKLDRDKRIKTEIEMESGISQESLEKNKTENKYD